MFVCVLRLFFAISVVVQQSNLKDLTVMPTWPQNRPTEAEDTLADRPKQLLLGLDPHILEKTALLLLLFQGLHEIYNMDKRLPQKRQSDAAMGSPMLQSFGQLFVSILLAPIAQMALRVPPRG